MTGRREERYAAQELGLTHYFTGRPCVRGHIAQRYVISKVCMACAAEKRPLRAEAHRAYLMARYWETHTPKTVFPSKDPSYHSRYSKLHYLENKQDYHARERARRIAVRGNGGHHTGEDIALLLKRQHYRCACCKVSVKLRFEVDHIVPVSKGGGNGVRNLQILCRPCNRRKSARDPIVFMQSQGFLL